MSDKSSESECDEPKIIEKPKRVMSEKQKEAFKKAQMIRQENIMKRLKEKEEKIITEKLSKLKEKEKRLESVLPAKPIEKPEEVSEDDDEPQIVVVKPKKPKKKKKQIVVVQDSDSDSDDEPIIQKVKKVKDIPPPPVPVYVPTRRNICFY